MDEYEKSNFFIFGRYRTSTDEDGRVHGGNPDDEVLRKINHHILMKKAEIQQNIEFKAKAK